MAPQGAIFFSTSERVPDQDDTASILALTSNLFYAGLQRAKATLARFEPRRLATSIPQRLSFENRVMRDSRTLAAS